MPHELPLKVPSLLERMRPLTDEGAGVYLVGGAVRDLLLGREVHDFDFALEGSGIQLARKAANKLKGDFYVLDEERDAGRVLLETDKGRLTLDFTGFRGKSLEANLAGRDFTINAMALELRDPQALLDPLNGANDLQKRVLRACSEGAFEDDAVRVMRAVRMAASFKLKIEESTRAGMRAAVGKLAEVSAERTRDELLRVLLAPKPATSLRALDMLGALMAVLPELEPMKGCVQSDAHLYDVWGHTLRVVESLEKVLGLLDEDYPAEGAGNLLDGLIVQSLGRYRKEISAYLREDFVAERPMRGLLFLAALYHDSGKPASKAEVEGQVRFPGHQAGSARIAGERAQALKLSNAEAEYFVGIVENHSLPTILMKTMVVPDRRAIYHYFQATGAAGPAIGLHSVADLMGKFGPELDRDALQARLDVVRALMEGYWEQYYEVVAPKPLLDGQTLIERFKLKAGPQVGEILAALREAQAAGEVGTEEEAIQFVVELERSGFQLLG